jgi:thiamine-phosphate pyrophosphorylase
MTFKGVDFRHYQITEGSLTDSSEPDEIEAFFGKLEVALKGGAAAIQLREKGLGGAKLLQVARGLRELTSRYGARLFINDRLDVALLSNADGLHLGTKGLTAAEVREWLKERNREALLIGVSTHSVEEAKEAERAGADFITFGPVFFTKSKAAYGAPVGLEKLREAKSEVSIPIFAIGGINEERIKEVKAHGAFGVAMISAILLAKDIEKSAKLIIDECNK